MPEFALDSATRRRLRPGGYLAIIAAVIIAAMLASNVNDSAHAAEKPPTVTWTRTVTNVAGRDLCKYNATVTTTAGVATRGALLAVDALALDYESPSDGKVVIHSDPFVCPGPGNTAPAAPSPTPGPAGSPTPGPAGSPKPANNSATNLEPARWSQPATADVEVTPVSFADVRNEAAGIPPLAKWIIGAVVGVVVAAVIAVAGTAAIVSAAAAVGVTVSLEVAGFAAACLGGATGGAIGEYIKGNTKPKIASSAVVGCAGGAFIAKFTSLLHAREVLADAAIHAQGFNWSDAASEIASGASNHLPELATEANAVAALSTPLGEAVSTALQHSAAS